MEILLDLTMNYGNHNINFSVMYSKCKCRGVNAALTLHYPEHVQCVCVLKHKYQRSLFVECIRRCLTTDQLIKSLSSLHCGPLRIKTGVVLNEQKKHRREQQRNESVHKRESVWLAMKENKTGLFCFRSQRQNHRKEKTCTTNQTFTIEI